MGYKWVENRFSMSHSVWNYKSGSRTVGGFTLVRGKPVKWWALKESGTVRGPKKARNIIEKLVK